MWIRLTHHIEHVAPTNWEERCNFPLWSPHLLHRDSREAVSKQVFQRILRGGGIEALWDITNRNGRCLLWTDRMQTSLPE